MDSVLDLECAARYRQKRERFGLTILRPAKSSKIDQAAIDSVIDNVVYRCPASLHLGQADDVKALAEEVTEWARGAAD